MGILRTILALAVIVYHSYLIFGVRMCGGQVAVETFYIISGFYMALILNEKYIGVGHYKKFITSRFYRIFPVYWIVLGLALLVSLIGYFDGNHPYYLYRYLFNYSCLSGVTILYFVFENIIVIGQDLFYFLKLDEYCQPQFTYNVLSYKHTAYQYLLVPQAWSISIEFMFYLMAPFLVTKRIKWQIGLVAIGLSCKYYFANYYNLSFDPWTYRFFPFELAFFIAGSIAYVFYKYIQHKLIPVYVGYIALLTAITFIFIYEYIEIDEQLKNSLFYVFVFIAIPFIFKALKNNKIDRYIGELSFSLYICHHIVVSLCRGYFFSNPSYLYLYGYTVVICSFILAFSLQVTVIKALESYRLKRFS